MEDVKCQALENFKSGDFAKAKTGFETVVKFEPDDAQNWFHLAVCYENLDDYITAENAYNTAIGLNPDYIDAIKNLCVLHVKNNEAKKAVELGKSILGKVDDYSVYYIIGTACMAARNFIESIFFLGKALELNPKHAQIYNNLGTCYISTGELDRAREAYEKACKLEPKNDLTIFNIGSIYQVQENHKKAIEYFQKAWELEPEDEYLVAMALSETKLGQYDAAIGHYKILAANNPAKPNYRYNLAGCYEAKGDYINAAGILAQLVMMNPKSAAMMAKLARVYTKLNQPLHAKELYDKIIMQGSASFEIYYEFASICARTGDLDTAEKNFKKALSLTGDAADNVSSEQCALAHKDLGVIYLGRRQFDWARDEFCQALEIAPNDSSIVFEYANFLHATADFEQADKMYKRALALDPENPDILGFSALNKIHTQDWDTAVGQIEKVIAAHPAESFFYYIAGRLKFLKKEYEQAKNYLVRSYELKPTNDAQNLLGLCYYELENFAQANEIFTNLLKESPANVNLMLSSANCYEKLGNFDAAIAQAQEAVEIFPECEEAHELIRRLS